MSNICQVTGKKPGKGHSYSLRGIAKKKKGIGLKVTGKTKRRFFPNLVTKRLWSPDEQRFIKLTLSTAALRTMDKLGVDAVLKKAKVVKK